VPWRTNEVESRWRRGKEAERNFFQWKIIGRAKSGDWAAKAQSAINQGAAGIQVTALTHLTCGVSSVNSVTCFSMINHDPIPVNI